MRKFFAVAMGSVVALAGFAGTASASSTIDLIWITKKTPTGCMLPANRNCNELGATIGEVGSEIAVSDNVTLLVMLTAGAAGSIGAAVSVDYGEVMASYSVTAFSSKLTKKPLQYLTLSLGDTTDQPPFISSINAGAAPSVGSGIGLPAGVSAYLGTVSFVKDFEVNGTFEISVGINGPDNTDKCLDGVGNTVDCIYNSAFLVNVPEPGALSLLVMGVGGMLLAGSGRRS
jgi:hypothetical protein